MSDVCLSVAYIGPKSTTERPGKTKIDTEVAHVTRDSDTTFKAKRSKVGCSSNYIIYTDDTTFYATAQSEPLPVDHEYSWRKARWAPQAKSVYGLELGCSVRRTGAGHIARLPAQLVL